MAIQQLLKLKVMPLVFRCFVFCILSFLVFCVLYFAFEYFEEGYLRASFRAAKTPSQIPNLRISKYTKVDSPDDLFVFLGKLGNWKKKKSCAKKLLE